MPDDISVDYPDLKNKLVPVLKNNFRDRFTTTEDWVENIVKNVRDGFNSLLPFTPEETEFIQTIKDGKGIKPELFIQNTHLFDFNAIKSHPTLLWAGGRSMNDH